MVTITPYNQTTIIVPVFNEENTIKGTMSKILKLKNRFRDLKILVINDGSSDQTSFILNNLNQSHDFEIIEHELNMGYGAALKTGIQACTTEYVLFYDSDGQHRIEDAFKILERNGEFDLTVGYRQNQKVGPSWRLPLKKLLINYFKFMLGRNVKDPTSGLRIWKTKKIKRVLSFCSDGFSFSATSLLMAYQLNYRVNWVEVEMNERQFGRSGFKPLKTARIISKLLKISFLFSPLKFLVPISVILITFGLFLVALKYFSTGESSIRGILLIILSVLVYANGLVIDFISKVQKNLISNL